MHIIASATTLTKASDKQANVRRIDTEIADASLIKKIEINETNCKIPIKIM
jgi:hypothetical protein